MPPHTSNATAPFDAVTTTASAVEDDPLWYKDAIIYETHVKAFFDTNQDGIGDFAGLTQKLDYLQGLGVTCLWLLPFFPSPLRDDGYDIADYLNVHPSYGTLDDFKALVAAAHERHIRVLIELVVNHTSDQHPWFQRARRAPRGAPERDFYIWSDTDKQFPETRIIFLDTEKSNWTYDPVAGQYYWHRFFSHQPDLNHNNPAVVEAVIDVMKFWLDIGVDALRLDAVPYLCVREGTNNENLPETHAVLKRMRRALDAAYANRMLLAEANQWPSDVRAYFGGGDECHMAFHFPLMPRMFMALQQEDRHAITEILNQTPDIPDTCQWALFLRNHDELTLEMVTDEERDYMYSVYAGDPQMRLNLGIRRRLAPLMENSRRRVELLNMLLFSLPGTPIIYYGDEIGMGDNIYLGDRNGVRTPMQWSGDRNGGFSRADPARLYAPPIMDPVYGYQAINIEAQERFPWSLLNWMKRLTAMRRQHRVFGRGALEIIYGPNRKILSFLRRDANETILVVANLSRTVQPTELDLRQFAGLIPVEMWGLTEFPRIGEQPYFLTLGPYASYWFILRSAPLQLGEKVSAAPAPAAAAVEAIPALLAGVDWETVLSGGTRVVLERQALRPFLRRQRWFASKSREIRQARITDWAGIRHGAHPAFLAIVSVEYTDGWTESYFVPLTLLSGAAAEQALKQTPESVLAAIAGARKGAIVDALSDDDTCERFLQIVAGQEQVATELGTVGGVLQRKAGVPPPADGRRKWIRGGGDQSNTIVFANEEYVLKVLRRIEPGPNPEFELMRALTEGGFARIPAFVGNLDYRREGLQAGTLALVQTAVTNQGSGWQHAIDELRRYYEQVATHTYAREEAAEADPPPFFQAVQRLSLISATLLGRRTAEMHRTLADRQDNAFVPEPLDPIHLNRLAVDMRKHADAIFERLAGRLESLESSRVLAERVLAGRAHLVAGLDDIRLLTGAGSRIRVHGDYHLGQLLRTEEDFVILDFEGEPSRPLAERRAKQSPLKDVAGMLQSYTYAAYAALFAFSTHAPDTFDALEPWAAAWRQWIGDAFVREYRKALTDATFLPDESSFTALLRALTVDKALYELAYELNHRPEWVRIPLTALLKMLP